MARYSISRHSHDGRYFWKVLVVISIASYSTLAVLFNRRKEISESIISQLKPKEIWIITPTSNRYTQLADLTRLAQTLSLVSDVHWVIVEDATERSEKIEQLLSRSRVSSTHMVFKTPPKFPGRGWAQRNFALDYIRNKFKNATSADLKKIIYFGDDDNTYDIRLFENYIRRVKKIGVWAVAFTGGSLVEAPRVNESSKVVGWDTVWAPTRPFAIDMAGFAISIDLILNKNSTFDAHCDKRNDGPETCFIEQFGIRREDLEPFGYNKNPKEVLVWHTKTENYEPLRTNSSHEYIF